MYSFMNGQILLAIISKQSLKFSKQKNEIAENACSGCFIKGQHLFFANRIYSSLQSETELCISRLHDAKYLFDDENSKIFKTEKKQTWIVELSMGIVPFFIFALGSPLRLPPNTIGKVDGFCRQVDFATEWHQSFKLRDIKEPMAPPRSSGNPGVPPVSPNDSQVIPK